MLAFTIEFFTYLKSHKKMWLLPIIVILLLVGGILALAQSSAVAPFIYTVF